MRLKLSVTACSLLCMMGACYQPDEIPENKELSKKLFGEWRNVALRLSMNTYNNRDTTRLFEVKEGEWEEKMKIRPIRTLFKANGIYTSEHYNLQDKLVYSPAGRWVIQGDTLIMRDTFPEPALSYRYKLVISGDEAQFIGKEDCDRDGWQDDDYFGIQRRVK